MYSLNLLRSCFLPIVVLSDTHQRIVNYVSGSAAVIRRGAGIAATDADLKRFQVLITESDFSRHHTFAFANEYEPEWLANQVAESLREELGGTFIFGVYTDTDNSNHIHVAEAGTSHECFMDSDDIDRVRQGIAARLPESIGDGDSGGEEP
ncbi:hypothetical protein [Haladaptatus halobius]|uniref:hypothetical protein n=1 Tax=Haladaptatus halobius TaxID=2884875 RepID=UPI001D0A3E32|nr:hypothetical protein [Haladaptatus halobius]